MGNGNSNKKLVFWTTDDFKQRERGDDRISNNVMVQNNHINKRPGTIIDLYTLHFFYYNFADGK